MADVTIGNLPPGIALGQCFVPLSDTLATVKVRVSALQVDYANITGKPDVVAIPAGGIILWSGAANAIPAGWTLCNGANGTPNLVDKFVLGAGASTPAVGATGGSKDAVVVSHTHTVTDPGHAHTTTINPDSNTGSGLGSLRGNSDPTTSRVATSTVATGISIAAAGVTGTGANMPPYYALCYIMKT